MRTGTPNTNPHPDTATQMNMYGSGSRNPGCDQLEPPTCTSRLKRKVLYHAKTEDTGHGTVKRVRQKPVLRFWIRDPVPCGPLDPGWKKIRIRDENPRLFFQELRNNLLGRFEIFLMRIRTQSGIFLTLFPGWKSSDPGYTYRIRNHGKNRLRNQTLSCICRFSWKPKGQKEKFLLKNPLGKCPRRCYL